MEKLINLNEYPIKNILDLLLIDKTTRKNIIFATNTYAKYGENYSEKSQITKEKLLGFNHLIDIRPRVEKAADEQLARTRKKAEVFTPSWIVNKMNNHCDEEWFGRPNVFNVEDGTGWKTNPDPIVFEGKKTWKKYVDSLRVEITCGEAPYIVSRYDAATGEIIPMEDRIGILDRKLRVVNENAVDDAEWLKYCQRAFQSSYGYEFQGDNLLIARINVLMTFYEYYQRRFSTPPEEKLLRSYANIICWNFWQMDGITGTIPFAVPEKPEEAENQFCLFEPEEVPDVEKPDTAPICKVKDWRNLKKSISYDDIRGGKKQ